MGFYPTSSAKKLQKISKNAGELLTTAGLRQGFSPPEKKKKKEREKRREGKDENGGGGGGGSGDVRRLFLALKSGERGA